MIFLSFKIFHEFNCYCHFWRLMMIYIFFPLQGTITDADTTEIRMWTHSLLLKICTSSKLGIVFQDALYGTSNIQKNYTLCNFLQVFYESKNVLAKKCLYVGYCPFIGKNLEFFIVYIPNNCHRIF